MSKYSKLKLIYFWNFTLKLELFVACKLQCWQNVPLVFLTNFHLRIWQNSIYTDLHLSRLYLPKCLFKQAFRFIWTLKNIRKLEFCSENCNCVENLFRFGKLFFILVLCYSYLCTINRNYTNLVCLIDFLLYGLHFALGPKLFLDCTLQAPHIYLTYVYCVWCNATNRISPTNN